MKMETEEEYEEEVIEEEDTGLRMDMVDKAINTIPDWLKPSGGE